MAETDTPKHTLDVEYVRAQFPALKSGFIFADNAGGSQITQSSIGASSVLHPYYRFPPRTLPSVPILSLPLLPYLPPMCALTAI
jgi:hypothetical protein